MLPQALSPPTDEMPEGEPATDLPWLEPYPSASIHTRGELEPGPEVRANDWRRHGRGHRLASFSHGFPTRRLAGLGHVVR